MKKSILLILFYTAFNLLGCQPSNLTIEVIVSNNTGKVIKADFYVLKHKIYTPIIIEPNKKITFYLPSNEINERIEEQGFATGNLKLVSESEKISYEICGYIEVATNKVCGKNKHHLNIEN